MISINSEIGKAMKQLAGTPVSVEEVANQLRSSMRPHPAGAKTSAILYYILSINNNTPPAPRGGRDQRDTT
jgi:hypothetical protein